MVDADCIREVSQRLVSSAAEEGNAVIVGRGAAYHLHDRPDALHVFVYAPFEEKVRGSRAGKREKEAIELVTPWIATVRNTSKNTSMWSGPTGISFT